ncbi:MAG: leucine-rich repeat domain-containing protein [Clostridia bacterium]|nr:leucine-rich repeat domain-containing protein [Clostridia bacterium]
MKRKWLIIVSILLVAALALCFAACNLISRDSADSGPGSEKGGDAADMTESYREVRTQLEELTDVLIPMLGNADADLQVLDGNGAQGFNVTITGRVSQATFDTFVRYFDEEFADWERSDGGDESPYPTMMYRGENGMVGVAWIDGEKRLLVTVMLGQSGGNGRKDHEHEGEWIVDTLATCTQRGTRHRVCTICGETQTESYGDLGHVGDWVTVKEATCTDDGKEMRVCTACGQTDTQKIDRTGHTPGGAAHTVKSVTCGVGIKYTICATCGAYVYAVNPADTAQHHRFDENGVCTTCGEHRATEGLIYDTTGDTAVVIGYRGAETEIFIPSYYDGKRVTEIGANAFKESNLTAVTIAEGVEKVGEYAFSSCNALVSVTIPATLMDLEMSSFAYSRAILEIHYGGEPEGWLGMANLYGIMYDHAIGRVLYIDGELMEGALSIPSGIKNVPSYAFYMHNGLTSLSMGGGMLTIGDNAFRYCGDLAEVNFAPTVKSIGEEAFYSCPITTLELPAALTRIERDTFGSCRDLVTARLPLGIKSIGYGAFAECISMTTINLPEGLTEIGDNAFGDCSALTSLAFPSTLTKIGDRALISCGCKLTSLTVAEGNPVYRSEGNCLIETAKRTVILGCNVSVIPRGILVIGKDAFVNCSSMTAIALPDTLTTIEERAFGFARKLTSITIPNEVTEIKASAFASCSGLTTVNLSLGLEKIGERAFDCYNLTDVNFGGTKAQWNAIEKEEGWLRTNGDCTIHCSDGDLEKE